MFFDTQGPDEAHQELLIAIAKKQRELLERVFDWKERKQKADPRRGGLFGRKQKADPVCERLLAELESLKGQLKRHRQEQGCPNGVFWWNIPWEQVECWLICDLEQPREEGGWRYANELDAIGEDGVYLLCLKEEGHLSDFSTSYHYSVHEESKYSYSERQDMVRSYNRRISNYDLMDLATGGDGPVHSVLSGADYASKADYYLSSEYFMTREYLLDSYSRSLYTQVETNGIMAVSRSRHYECFFQVADFHVREDGTLDHMGLRDFEFITARGDAPDSLRGKYEGRDAAVVCAGYLADSDMVREVPLALFGRDMEQGAACFEEAMRQAEVYTCLAEKIHL